MTGARWRRQRLARAQLARAQPARARLARAQPARALPARVAAGDEGSGTVLVIALLAVALVLAAAIGTLGGAQVARGRAQVAADLAALAAADVVALPPGVTVTAEALRVADPCARAVTVAERNAAKVTSCVADPGGVVTVTVAVDGGRGPFALTATARARAGPQTARDGR